MEFLLPVGEHKIGTLVGCIASVGDIVGALDATAVGAGLNVGLFVGGDDGIGDMVGESVAATVRNVGAKASKTGSPCNDMSSISVTKFWLTKLRKARGRVSTVLALEDHVQA